MPRGHRRAQWGNAERMDDSKVSVMVPVFRAAGFVAEALEAIFAQVTDAMEVLIFDDASDDGTLEVIDRVVTRCGRGRIQVVRHARKQRAFNFLEMVRRSHGEILVWFHGDDVPLPHRLRTVLAAFDDPRTMLVSSNCYDIDPDGRTIAIYAHGAQDHVVDDAREYLDVTCRESMVGCSLAWRRSLVEDFPLDMRLMIYGEDMVLPFRAALVGRHQYISEPLVRRRVHPGNNHALQGAHFADGPMRENVLWLEQSCLYVRRNDVAWLLQRRGPDPALEALLQAVERRLLDHLQRWLALRGELVQRALKPTWEPIELSRSVPCRFWVIPFGTELVLGRNSPGGGLLIPEQGWHEAEPWGVWATGAALLTLRFPAQPDAPLRASFHWRTFREEQSVEVSAEGTTLWEGRPGTEPVDVTFDVPAGAVRGQELTLLLRTTPPERPSDHADCDDTRSLGVGLLRIAFQREAAA